MSAFSLARRYRVRSRRNRPRIQPAFRPLVFRHATISPRIFAKSPCQGRNLTGTQPHGQECVSMPMTSQGRLSVAGSRILPAFLVGFLTFGSLIVLTPLSAHAQNEIGRAHV